MLKPPVKHAVSHITCSVTSFLSLIMIIQVMCLFLAVDANVKLLPVSCDQPHANLSALTEEEENQFKIQCLTQE